MSFGCKVNQLATLFNSLPPPPRTSSRHFLLSSTVIVERSAALGSMNGARTDSGVGLNEAVRAVVGGWRPRVYKNRFRSIHFPFHSPHSPPSSSYRLFVCGERYGWCAFIHDDFHSVGPAHIYKMNFRSEYSFSDAVFDYGVHYKSWEYFFNAPITSVADAFCMYKNEPDFEIHSNIITNQSINRSIDRIIKQSINQSLFHSIDQS